MLKIRSGGTASIPPEGDFIGVAQDIFPSETGSAVMMRQLVAIDYVEANRSNLYFSVMGSIGGVVGFTGGVTVDRFGHIYLELGWYWGLVPGVGASGTIGIVARPNHPTERQLQAFLRGKSYSCGGGIVSGGGITWNKRGTAAYTGFTTPELGCSSTWAFELN